MRLLRLIHTAYGLVIFTSIFLLFLPLFFIPMLKRDKFNWVGILNRWWAKALLTLVFIPFSIEYRSKLNAKSQYIFCPNHFSYFDIPTLGLNKHNTIFVGKSDIEKVPLFGYMYKKLHITVNRASLKSRVNSLKESAQAIDEGKSLVIFPEGGIMTDKDPVMGKFKDGAFRIAIEKQIPIVPVTIPFNWIILPADQFVLHWHRLKIIFHDPIDTTGLTLQDVDVLKNKVFNIINQELQKHLKPDPIISQQ